MRLEEENQSRYDGVIHFLIHQGNLPRARSHEPPSRPQNLDEMLSETFERHRTPISEGEKWIVTNARDNPHFCLAEKIGGHRDRYQRIDLYQGKENNQSNANAESEDSLGIEPLQSTQNNRLSIEASLQEAIRVKEFLDPLQALISAVRQKRVTETADLPKTVNLPWYKKSKWALAGLVVSILVSIGSLIGLALTGFLLTYFIALPIFFLASAILIGIKIGYDHRSRPSVVKTNFENNSAHVDTQYVWREYSRPEESSNDNDNDNVPLTEETSNTGQFNQKPRYT